MPRPLKLSPSVARSLKALVLMPSDDAAVALVKKLAAEADADPELLNKAAWVKAYLDALEVLGMTPKARAGVMRGRTTFDGATKLDELRNRRQNRATLIHG